VLLDAGDADLLVARVTTQPYGTRYDVPLLDWRAAGLLAPSVLRLHKLATLERSLFGQTLGHVSAADHDRIASVLHATYAQWP
jgi:mRNA interferase MazF